MGMYDSIIVKCPRCGVKHEFQSKSGKCTLGVYSLKNCPNDVLTDANRHSPYECKCGSFLSIDIPNKSVLTE